MNTEPQAPRRRENRSIQAGLQNRSSACISGRNDSGRERGGGWWQMRTGRSLGLSATRGPRFDRPGLSLAKTAALFRLRKADKKILNSWKRLAAQGEESVFSAARSRASHLAAGLISSSPRFNKNPCGGSRAFRPGLIAVRKDCKWWGWKPLQPPPGLTLPSSHSYSRDVRLFPRPPVPIV